MLNFIDDYITALAVRQVACPMIGLYRIAHAKLTYLMDSSANNLFVF